AAAPAHAILAPPFGVTSAPGASVDAPSGTLGTDPLILAFARLAALAPHVVASGDTAITAGFSGALVVPGNLVIHGGAVVDGLIVASGSITIQPGAVVAGAVHAGGLVTVGGSVSWHPC